MIKVIKNINNNWVLGIDDNGNELIAYGKGLGFPTMPYMLNDMSKVDRTFYGMDEKYVHQLENIPIDVFNLAAKIADIAKGRIDKNINPNLAFTLADHINFSIERYKKNIKIKMPLIYDIQQLYPTESEIGLFAVKLINKTFHIYLNECEATGIAMNIINAECSINSLDEKDDDLIIDEIVLLIESIFKININRDSMNYSRFATHMIYLLKRIDEKKSISSDNIRLLSALNEEYPLASESAYRIKDYLFEKKHRIVSEEEIIYLILHINRLTSREGV